jgi:hypothetical protein
MKNSGAPETTFFEHWNFNKFPKSYFLHSKVDWHNNFGYRGNDFKEFEEGKRYLITIGDSWTFCSGIHKEIETWPYLLSKKLECDYYYNLAIGGRSIDYVSRALHLFFEIYKPKGKIYLAGIFPSTLRTEFFTDNGTYVSNIRNISELEELGNIGKLVSLTAYRKIFKNAYTNVDKFLRNYLLVEYICKSYNIEFVWANWYMFFRTAINNDSKINNFYYNFCYNNKHFLDMFKYFEDLKIEFEYLSNDDKHPNHKMQSLMADAFFKFLTKQLSANISADKIEFNENNTECEYRDGYEKTLY